MGFNSAFKGLKNKIVYFLQQYFERVELLSDSQLSLSMCCMELALCI